MKSWKNVNARYRSALVILAENIDLPWHFQPVSQSVLISIFPYNSIFTSIFKMFWIFFLNIFSQFSVLTCPRPLRWTCSVSPPDQEGQDSPQDCHLRRKSLGDKVKRPRKVILSTQVIWEGRMTKISYFWIWLHLLVAWIIQNETIYKRSSLKI